MNKEKKDLTKNEDKDFKVYNKDTEEKVKQPEEDVKIYKTQAEKREDLEKLKHTKWCY